MSYDPPEESRESAIQGLRDLADFIEYEALTIAPEHTANYNALMSYRGSVQPK